MRCSQYVNEGRINVRLNGEPSRKWIVLSIRGRVWKWLEDVKRIWNTLWMRSRLSLLLLLLIKEIDSARLGESYLHPISPKTPVPQHQPVERNKKRGKTVEERRDWAAYRPKNMHDSALEPASPTPSNTWPARSFHRDT